MTELKDRRELLSFLTPRVQQFHVSDGGLPILTQIDVAHILGTIQIKEVVMYGRIKYIGETKWLNSVAKILKCSLDTRKWRETRFEWIFDMCRLALIESIDPNKCFYCDGVAELIDDSGKHILCQSCSGSGNRIVRDADRAWALGISPPGWSRWSPRYQVMFDQAKKYDDILYGALKRRAA